MKSLRQEFYELATMIFCDIDYPNISIPIFSTFYVILGQWLKDVKIVFGSEVKSLRISVFWVQNSRTGKGQLIKILERIAKLLGLKTTRETYVNEAGIIGTINEHAIQHNYKGSKVLKEGDEGWENPITYGDLKDYDIVVFSEAKGLLLESNFKDNLLSELQEALDTPGIIRKKLRNQVPVEYECKASIFATTYYLSEVSKLLITQGYFQRNLFYMKEFTPEENDSLREKIIEMYRSRKTNIEEFDKKCSEFANKIKKISRNERFLVCSSKAVDFLQEIRKKFDLEIRKASGDELKILMSFSQTVIDISVIIAGIHCCLRNGEEINESEISLGYTFSKSCLDTIINKLIVKESKFEDINKDIKVILNVCKILIKDDKKVSKEMLVEECHSKGIKIGRNKILRLINKMIIENYFKQEKGEKNIQYLKIND